MKVFAVLLSTLLAAFIGFAAAACGSGAGAEEAGPVPPAQSGTQTTTAEGPVETVDVAVPSEDSIAYQVWFTQGEGLFVVERTHQPTPRVGSAALEDLLAGPSGEESEVQVGSAVPAGTRLLGLTIDDGIATVDLTSEFESGGGSLSMQMRLAQVVYTLTQFPTVKGVLLSLDGERVDVLGGEGIVIDHPLTRKDYEELLPAILVARPAIGQVVGSPARVSGSANVFEANVTIVILDGNGDELARTFTTATCGTGCRGTFSAIVPFEVESEQPGTIVVQDDDAAGTGHPPHEVRIPVVLSPAA